MKGYNLVSSRLRWNSLEPKLVLPLIITQSKDVGKGVYFSVMDLSQELGKRKSLGKRTRFMKHPKSQADQPVFLLPYL